MTHTASQIFSLRSQARKLKIEGWRAMSAEQLEQAIAEAIRVRQ
jgi:hypothetical protein